MTTENDNCDGAGPHTEGEVRYLPANARAGHILCRACFGHEIVWRRLRNREVANPFDLPSWAELEVYPKPDVAQEQARMRRRNAKTIGL